MLLSTPSNLSMAKIVFYIRALFHESVMKKIENVDAFEFESLFNKLSNMPLKEYRQRVHEIQLLNLSSISQRIIINSLDVKTNRLPYSHIQPEALQQLLSLDDTDILIPLDDDDWISPDIKNFPFIFGLSGWNCVSLNPKNWSALFTHTESKPFLKDHKFSEEELIIFNKGLLSNCQAFSGAMIKNLVKHSIEDARHLLQHHTRCREITKKNNFNEYLSNRILAVYVRHACNITSFAGWIKNKKNSEKEVLEELQLYKNMYKHNINLPAEYVWMMDYIHMLAELNRQL
jgi:hypothetical protein